MLQAPSIQWFPGHMAKTRRLMRECLPRVDVVVELRDARIPRSSRNPELGRLIGKKPRVVLLNKADEADEKATRAWLEDLKGRGITALATDCKSGKGLGQFVPAVRSVMGQELQRRASKGMAGRPIRIMIVGIPNAGKSSLINRLAKSRRTKVEDRPGVTRGKQWVKLDSGLELLDMPGVLWPKFDDQEVGEHLAYTGAIKDDILDLELLAMRLLGKLRERYGPLLCQRYRIQPEELDTLDEPALLELVARRRGMLLPGNEANTERAAITVLDEFRSGKIGRITLELPGEPRRPQTKGQPSLEEHDESAGL